MPTEDITPTVFPEGEQPQQTEQQEAQPQPEAPEYIPFKVRGQERQISASNLDALANELGANRDTALMWLQSGKDYGQHVSEYRQRERELAQREAQVNAYLQQIEQERQARTVPRQPTGPQPAGVPTTDDPMEILRWQAQQLLAIQQRVEDQQKAFNEEREYFKQAMARHEEQRIEGEIVDTWQAFEKDLKAKNLPVIPYEEIEREALMSGLAHNTRLPLKEVFQRAYRNLAWDDVQSNVEKTTMQKLRDPRATVTVPGGSAAPTPKPKGSEIEQALGSMKMGEVIEFIPERR